jgi:hypothetical protein
VLFGWPIGSISDKEATEWKKHGFLIRDPEPIFTGIVSIIPTFSDVKYRDADYRVIAVSGARFTFSP